MSAPKQKPFFFDMATGEERTVPQTGADMAALIDRIATAAGVAADWAIEDGAHDGLAVRLSLIEHAGGRRVVVGFSAGTVEGRIVAEPDPSGWVRVTAETAGAERFRAYVDRPYEEHELWPEGADAAAGGDIPGRAGKRLLWVSLSAEAWPVLAPLAAGGWFNAEAAEPGARRPPKG